MLLQDRAADSVAADELVRFSLGGPIQFSADKLNEIGIALRRHRPPDPAHPPRCVAHPLQGRPERLLRSRHVEEPDADLFQAVPERRLDPVQAR